ncbi:type I-B CRISPR-associated protein Cas7/Cst2/DevR [Actinokineospora auranticolor]|uniref:CRISPR-associated protein Cst2 n=1 Tax=Actinokineospora auranticolor TaxID=155976 RepID=A0A2S6GLY2_9PSEU|nr:type I-B CRISPR-associated protein Cas7/Cst2/DevR [Actinokineospora auranticolor]PPK66225.1 CRISPR-associated protein Cst2 [Actinokineospora auranticolor]
MTFLVGKVAIDVVAGAPNNGESEDTTARVKQLRVGRDIYPYVSAQAFRRWLRDSLPNDEPRSTVVIPKGRNKQQAYTAGRPDRFLDDDLFGYMVAVKSENFQRDTVLATGTFVSLAPQRPTKDFGTMSRDFPTGQSPVLHSHELYSGVMAGDVLLDLPRAGVFETAGSGLRTAFSADTGNEAVKAGATATTLRGNEAVALPMEERRRRVALLLETLAAVRGGAKRSLHYGDRTPSLVLLVPMKGGVNPFTRVFGLRDGRPGVLSSVLREELAVWADELDGPVSLGWAPGFLGDDRDRCRDEIHDLLAEGTVQLDHPRVLLRQLAEQIRRGDRDGWFTEPSV